MIFLYLQPRRIPAETRDKFDRTYHEQVEKIDLSSLMTFSRDTSWIIRYFGVYPCESPSATRTNN